jgi:putative peptidoglycan lipid II flippase
MSLLRHGAIVGLYTGLSRVFGLVREILMSHVLGASLVADAFIVAFKFPNFFRRFFAEGAFNAAFVPQFAGTLAMEGPHKAQQLAQRVFFIMAFFLMAFVFFVEIFTPLLMPLIAPGFSSTVERLELATHFTRITFPYIFFISLCALCAGVLNSLNRYAAAASAPILLNVVMIAALLLYEYMHVSPGYALAWSVFVAGIMQFIWMLWACKRLGMSFFIKPTFQCDEKVNRVFRLMIPGALGAGVMQINILIDMVLASFLPIGSMSYLYYADRLNQLPLSIFGIGMGTVLLPPLSKLWRQKDEVQALKTQNHALSLAMQFTMPAAVGLVCLSHILIDVIFGHGKFTTENVNQTAKALEAFALGLPAYVASKIFATSFFAQLDTKTPVKIAAVCVGVNLVLNLIFMQYWQHVGLALATSASAWLNMFLLGAMFQRKGALHISTSLKILLFKILAASCVMFFVLKTTLFYLWPHMPSPFYLWHKIALILTLIFLGSSVYFGLLISSKGTIGKNF